jgi:hypothetical protein
MDQSLRSLTGRAGIGLRPGHYVEFIESRPPVGFIEAHSENYFGRGGKPLHFLKLARQSHPLSLHGVGLSIGSVDPLSEPHLARLHELIDMLEPALVSDHLCWCSVGGIHANDLLPLPFTEETLAHVVARVQRVQERLRRPILLENVSSYLEYVQSAMPEWEFPRGGGEAQRLRHPAGRQQRLRQRPQSRLRRDGLPAGHPPPGGGGNPPGRFHAQPRRRRRRDPDRHAQCAGGRCGVGALGGCAGALRPGADPGGVGRRHAAPGGAGRRGREG